MNFVHIVLIAFRTSLCPTPPLYYSQSSAVAVADAAVDYYVRFPYARARVSMAVWRKRVCVCVCE